MPDSLLIASIRTPDWQAKLGDVGAIVEDLDDIDQCILTILSTPKGAVPHQPEFGSDLWIFLDQPIGEARPNVVREIVEAVARWEPRVELTAVTFGQGDDAGSALIQIARRRAGSSATPGTIAFEVAT